MGVHEVKDTEAQTSLYPQQVAGRQSKLVSLGIYFAINLSLSTFNKYVLGKFTFPWFLTALHATATSLGCLILLWRGYFKLTELSRRENIVLAMFSTLFTINIAISNVSLAMVSIPFHQIMRSTCPVFTVLIYRFLYSKTYSTSTYLSLVPMTLGMGLATYGDYYFTVPGFGMTALGVLLASVKTVASNRLMTGNLKLHPMEILLRMSPLAALQSLAYAGMTGELQAIFSQSRSLAADIPWRTLFALAANSMLAFAQNVSSYQTNKIAGALTMTVCANLKQCTTIVLAIFMFDIPIQPRNSVGMIITMLGVAWYSKIALK